MFKGRILPSESWTTEGCRMLLETIIENSDSALIAEQEIALKALHRFCKKRCVKALTFIMSGFIDGCPF